MKAPKYAQNRPSLGAVSSASRVEGEPNPFVVASQPAVIDAEVVRSTPAAPTKSWWSGLSMFQKLCLGAVTGITGLGALLWWIDPPGAKRNAPKKRARVAEPEDEDLDEEAEFEAEDQRLEDIADDLNDSSDEESVLDGVGDVEEVEDTDTGLDEPEAEEDDE